MKLPSWTQSEIDRKIAQDGCVLIIANRFVYDVTDFLSSHPGEKILSDKKVVEDKIAQLIIIFTGQKPVNYGRNIVLPDL